MFRQLSGSVGGPGLGFLDLSRASEIECCDLKSREICAGSSYLGQRVENRERDECSRPKGISYDVGMIGNREYKVQSTDHGQHWS
jgi:hypothetical protein